MKVFARTFQNHLITGRTRLLQQRRFVVNCLLAATLSFNSLIIASVPAQAAVGSDPRLGQLEVKFFKHTYPKDEEAARLERLEKMIFGEVKSGASESRLKALADTVPNLGQVAAEDADSQSSSASTADASESGGASSASAAPVRAAGKRNKVKNADSDLDLTEERSKSRPGGQVLSGESKYPAITSLEQHIFNRDYAAEPVGDRLNRLETKVFGKPSKFTDLSERVDALKEKSRVDVARQPPPGTDWIDDDDDDINFPAPRSSVARSPQRSEPVPRTDGDDGRSFSGRDLRKDMQSAFGTRSSGGGYGMGSFGSSGGAASGAYGMGSGASTSSASASMPATAPRRRAQSQSDSDRSSGSAGSGSDRFDDAAPAVGAIGLSSKVTALENAVLGKSYAKDPLIERVGRLEETVFPSKSDTAASLSLPERVAKLVEKVPIAAAPPKTARANRARRDDFDMDDVDMGSASSLGGLGSMSSMGAGSGGMTMSSTQTRSGGLGKIINSIGSMLGGGYGGYAASYGMPGGGLVRDPSTGYMVDSMSGNLINPSTGQVVGRAAGYPSSVYTNGISTGYSSGYGTGLGGYGYGGVPIGGMPIGGLPMGMPMGVPAMGGYNSFNNGFSPYGFPGGGYGMGGSGIRFGGGNFGVRF
jgi:hypothetical protein